MTKAIYLDIDGTIADFYGVENWLVYLENENTTPYERAKPLCNMAVLARQLNKLQKNGYIIGIVSWTSKGCSDDFHNRITTAKKQWLAKHLKSVHFDEIQIIPYGTDKNIVTHNCGILFDDEERNRKQWKGTAYNVDNIIKTLAEIIKKDAAPEKIDSRKQYILMCDTETCNTSVDEKGRLDMSCALVYDIGWQIIDKKGNVYLSRSYIVDDIFNGKAELMKSAYYAKKLPQYYEDIKQGKRTVATLYSIRKQFIKDMETYNCKIVAAHNARFDDNALKVTQRWVTKSKYRYFLPYGVEIWDTLKMAKDVISTKPSYIDFCKKHNYMTKHKTPLPRLTAEILYRYISGNNDFIENHTGLEDVDIERQILAYCFRQHKRMRKKLYA